MDCCCNFLRGVCDFIVGSIRLILFIICALFVMLQLLWFGLVMKTKSSVGPVLPEADLNYQIFVHSLVLLGAGILGCYASFYKNHSALKIFALITAICAVVLIFLVATSLHPRDRKDQKGAYIDFLKENAKYYDWTKDGRADERKAKATETWNLLQSFLCCGIKGPDDWNATRPSSIPKDAYPSSCCPLGNVDPILKLCHKSHGIYNEGCLNRVEELEAVQVVFYAIFIAVLLLLCVLAIVCAFGSSSDDLYSTR